MPAATRRAAGPLATRYKYLTVRNTALVWRVVRHGAMDRTCRSRASRAWIESWLRRVMWRAPHAGPVLPRLHLDQRRHGGFSLVLYKIQFSAASVPQAPAHQPQPHAPMAATPSSSEVFIRGITGDGRTLSPQRLGRAACRCDEPVPTGRHAAGQPPELLALVHPHRDRRRQVRHHRP